MRHVTGRHALFMLIVIAGLCVPPAAHAHRSSGRDQPEHFGSVSDTPLASAAAGAPQSIAMTSSRDGNNEVYVMDPDGSNENRVTTANASNDQRPDISPDGSRIVFASNRDGNFEIFVMDSDGDPVTQLTSTSSPVANTWPRWSPDGEWIAFHSGTTSSSQIYRIRPDGSELTQVTNHPGLNQFPGWSPDGTRLAIRRNSDLYVIDSADGSNPVRLTSAGTVNQMASFSPDGTRIAFMSTREGNAPSVFIMGAGGENQDDATSAVNFTPKPPGYLGTWTSRAPAWSPNGQYIYYTAQRSVETGNTAEQIYVKPVGGGDEVQLTADGANSEATVRRVSAPTITGVTATPDVLWPANNTMRPVSLTLDVTDTSDSAPVCQITGVTSNEAAAETAWEITGPLTVDLRAQRFGMGTGRVYTITIRCTNSSQLSSSATVTVRVPHDQGR
jgi:Tol biopolymer transport system component